MIPMPLGEVAAALGSICPPERANTLAYRVTTDSRDVRQGDLFFAIQGPRFDGHDFVAAARARGAVGAVVAKPGFVAPSSGQECDAFTRIPVADTVKSLAQLAGHYRRQVLKAGTIVIAVTGSNGKTTTKSMIDHVLKPYFSGRASPRSFNNHLGVPLMLLSIDAEDRYAVVEVGMNAPGEIAALAELAAPHVGVITSIGEAHLEGLGSLEAIAAEKASLLQYIRPSGLAAVNVDRREVDPFLNVRSGIRLITFGQNPNARIRVTNLRGSLSGTTFDIEWRYRAELSLPGFHHATNAAAAFTVARWFGVAPYEIVARLRTFEAAEGRTRVIKIGPARVVDDSYNANPASVLAAIAVLGAERPGYRTLVLGDMLELGEESQVLHERVVRAALEAGIETLVVVGDRTQVAASRVKPETFATRIVMGADEHAVVEALVPLVAGGHTIWVKGSRAMMLDRVVRALTDRFAPRAAVA